MRGLISFFRSLMMLLAWSGRFIKPNNRNIGIKRIEQKRPVAILGNGASLNDTIKNGLSTEIDYCLVNFSPLSDLFFIIKPKYYVLADGAFFRPQRKDHVEKVSQLSLVLRKVDWKLQIFVPVIFLKEAREKFGRNDHIFIAAFNKNEINDSFSFKRIEYTLFKKGLATPILMNVGVASIYCLINSGYRCINLYGMEHSWIKLLSVDKDNYVCMKDVHYYDNDKNHDTKMYIGNRPERFHEQLRFQATTFASYWELKGYADYLGNVEIINKTKDSFIDAFRKDY